MRTLHFEGSSDDTFGLTNDTTDDYDNCASGKPIDFLVTAPGVQGGVIVTGQHARGDFAWQIGVAAFDPDGDDLSLPDWPIRVERGGMMYSPRLVIEVPDDAKIVHVGNDDA